MCKEFGLPRHLCPALSGSVRSWDLGRDLGIERCPCVEAAGLGWFLGPLLVSRPQPGSTYAQSETVQKLLHAKSEPRAAGRFKF